VGEVGFLAVDIEFNAEFARDFKEFLELYIYFAVAGLLLKIYSVL
jgi:hypothetical protein